MCRDSSVVLCLPRFQDMTYINLLDNPERFTGYVGEHAHRVWATIYNQGCLKSMAFPGFEPSQEHCAEYGRIANACGGLGGEGC